MRLTLALVLSWLAFLFEGSLVLVWIPIRLLLTSFVFLMISNLTNRLTNPGIFRGTVVRILIT